jgi:hypothetical protein
MKVKLELNINEGAIHLNYWDSLHGNDVCAKVTDHCLLLESGDGMAVSINEFIRRVKESSESE